MSAIRDFLRRSPAVVPLIRLKRLLKKPRPQNEEELILSRLLRRYAVPRRFVEFGFSGWEFNCASLVNEWEGLLVDGSEYNVTVARTILPRKIVAVTSWLTLENLQTIREFAAAHPLGILSVDVDGNDYWFLQELIHTSPSIIISEYNSSFGHKPVTVPYDPSFDRTKAHPSGLYFGASLSALTYLANNHGYALIDVGNSGINAYFVRRDLLAADDIELSPEQAFREKLFPDGARPSEQFDKIRHLPLIDVTALQEAGRSRA